MDAVKEPFPGARAFPGGVPGYEPEPVTELPPVRVLAATVAELERDILAPHQLDIWDPRRKELVAELHTRIDALRAHKELRRCADALARDLDDPKDRQHFVAQIQEQAAAWGAYRAQEKRIGQAEALKRKHPDAGIRVEDRKLKLPDRLPADVNTRARLAAYRSAEGWILGNTSAGQQTQLYVQANLNDKAQREAFDAAVRERDLDGPALFDRIYEQGHADDVFAAPAFTSALLGPPATANGQLPGADRIRGSRSFAQWLTWAGDRPEMVDQLAQRWDDIMEEAVGRGWLEVEAGRAYFKHNGQLVKPPASVSLARGVRQDAERSDPAAHRRELLRRVTGLRG